MSVEEEEMTTKMSALYKENEPQLSSSEQLMVTDNADEQVAVEYETELEALTAKIEEKTLFDEDDSKPPLPTESELEDMLSEIKELEQEESAKNKADKADEELAESLLETAGLPEVNKS